MLLEPPPEQSMNKSRLSNEEHLMVKVGKQDSSIQIIESGFIPVEGYNYRVVNNIPGSLNKHNQEKLFVDKEFTIDSTQLFDDQNIEIRRISYLYGLTNLQKFIDITKRPTHLADNEKAPACIQ